MLLGFGSSSDPGAGPRREIELTFVIRWVYDSTMPIARRVHPFVCLALAVSTAIGATVPARACGCSTPHKTETAVPKPTPQLQSPSISTACCPSTTGKRSCCSQTRDTAKPACCCETDPQPKQTRPDQPKPDASYQLSCECARCDCSLPEVPPASSVPTQSAPHTGEQLTIDSVIPPAFVPPPSATGSHATHVHHTRPPADLVISLSRLTC